VPIEAITGLSIFPVLIPDNRPIIERFTVLTAITAS